MKDMLRTPLARRIGMTTAVAVLLLIMTGPSGTVYQPTAGVVGSFSARSSFFGLFATQRWVVWLALTLIVTGVIRAVKFLRARVPQVNTVPREAVAAIKAPFRRRSIRFSSYGVVLLVALFIPALISDNFWQQSIVEAIAVYVLLALGLNVVVGFAGLLDLGFVAFYAIGAYVTAWVTGALPLHAPFGVHLDPFWAIPIAIAVAMVAGILLGIPTLRLRGDYLAIVTLGFGEIVTIFLNNLYKVTGGSTGSNQVPHFVFHVGPLKYAWGLGPVPYYYLTLGFVVLFLLAFSRLEHSRVGRAWTAIREDEVAAESLGINPLKFKVMAFAIGAASAGFAGVMTAAQTNFLSPQTFLLSVSINVLVLVIFGGMGSIIGVLVGAALVQFLLTYLDHYAPYGFQPADIYIYLGALLVATMIFRPAGLIPAKRRRREIAMAEAGEGHMDELLTGDTP